MAARAPPLWQVAHWVPPLRRGPGPEMAGAALLPQEVEDDVARFLEARQRVQAGEGSRGEGLALRQRQAPRRRHGGRGKPQPLPPGVEPVREQRPALRPRAVRHDVRLHLLGDRLVAVGRPTRLGHDAEVARIDVHPGVRRLLVLCPRVAPVARCARERVLGVRVLDPAMAGRALVGAHPRARRRARGRGRRVGRRGRGGGRAARGAGPPGEARDHDPAHRQRPAPSTISRPDFVIYATCEAAPQPAVTLTRSTASPWTKTGPPPTPASRMKLAEAVSTLGWSVGITRLAGAVVAAAVPVSVTVVELTLPTWPWTRTVTVVPGGILAPSRTTLTGFGVPAGRVTSGLAGDPAGAAGAGTPPRHPR